MFLTATAVAVAAVSLLLALTVLLRNPHSPYNLSFAFFAALLGLWIPANYFGSYQDTNIHLSFLFFMDFTLAPLLSFSFCVFGLEAARFYRRKTLKINRLLLVLAGGLAAILSLSAAFHLVSLPIYTPTNVLNTKEALYYPYNIFVELTALTGLLTLLYSTIRARPEYKQQAQLVLWGLLLMTAALIAANIVFPDIRLLQTLSYFSVLIMLLFLSYSIVKHRLFDIRSIVARSVAYILALGLIAAIISGLTFGAVGLVRETRFSPDFQRLFYVFLTIALVLSYPSLKKFFDRLTNRIFYRDAYDSQELLNSLNRSLVNTIILEDLLKKSSKIISDFIKSEYCVFAIKNPEEPRNYLLASGSGQINVDVVEKISHAAGLSHARAIVADELAAQKTSLKELMRAANISVMVKIESHSKGKSNHQGFILLGAKKSGGIYSEQDIQILEIIADELVIAIQNAMHFEEIQRFNATLQEKIEEATRQLRHANQKLKELDQTKDEFISMASHQLRTPLTTIKGYLSMVLEGDVGPVTKSERQMIQQAFDSAERMVFLIGDLLNVSRLQSGKFVIENKPTDLVKMVEAQVNQLKETAANHRLTLTFKKPDKFPLLSLDETKIQQVVMNFLDNAIYYTPAGGSITVALEASAKEIIYTVTDTGLGVPKNEQHHLFSKFYRAGNARKMRPDGTGLGLFMAKKVIAAQGGAIIFKSTEGQGSTFGFSFPRSKVEVTHGAPVKPAKEAVAA